MRASCIDTATIIGPAHSPSYLASQLARHTVLKSKFTSGREAFLEDGCDVMRPGLARPRTSRSDAFPAEIYMLLKELQ